jgi:hypothetical protein
MLNPTINIRIHILLLLRAQMWIGRIMHMHIQ